MVEIKRIISLDLKALKFSKNQTLIFGKRNDSLNSLYMQRTDL